MLVTQLLRDLEVQDVGTKLDVVFEIELHVFLFPWSKSIGVPFPINIYIIQ